MTEIDANPQNKDGQAEDPLDYRRRFTRNETSNLVLGKRKRCSRAQFLARLCESRIAPTDFRSHEVSMMQLSQTFLNIYFTRDIDSATLRSFLSLNTSSPAILNASKTLWAILLHRVSQDSRMLPVASGFYTEALRHAKVEVQHADKYPLRVVGTAHLLTICELFQGVSLDDNRITRPHARWLISYLESYRSDKTNIPMQRVRGSPVRLIAAWEMLLARMNPCRKALLPPLTDFTDGTMSSMSDLTMFGAEVLEECDKLCRSQPQDLEPILQLIERIIALQGALHEWMTNLVKSFDRSPYWLVEANDLPCPPGRSTRLLYQYLYEFADPVTHGMCVGYWTCLLALSDAHFSLLSSNELLLDEDPSTSMRVKSLADEYASHLSKGLHAVCKPSGAWGHRITVTGPLHLLLLYYKRHHDWKMLSWCVECAKDIGIAIERNPVASYRLAENRRRLST